MRVVGGSAKGHRLIAPRGRNTRPTADSVREAIFNVLGSRIDIADAHVLDLFAGSGALGIEALSRGAAYATLVDSDAEAVASIKANLAATGLADHADVIRQDVLRWLASPGPGEEIDVVFADPPYEFDDWAALLGSLSAELVVCESDRPVEPPEPWRVRTKKRYGGTVVTLIGT